MKKSRIVLMIAVVLSSINAFSPVEVMAGTRVCGKNGCQRQGGANGTVYCATHAAELAREKGYVYCGAYGCNKYVTKSSRYCYEHQCHKNGCSNQKKSGSDYCSTHQPKKTTYSGSTRRNSSYSGHSSGSGRKYDTYGVYDYKDAQSFADDMYEEFYDYEDDYDDEDEAYDAAVDYWYDHH